MSNPIPLTDQLSIAWIDWCRNEHIPANTTARRIATLRSIGNAGEATREEVEAWWAGRTDLAPASRANDLAGLRAFYKWLARWEHRGDDPTLRIDAPHVPAGLPHPMAKHDLHKALVAFEPQLRRAVCMGAYAGLRVSEAAGMDWADVDIEGRTFRVVGKGQKERVIAVSPILIDELLPDTGGNVVTAGHQAYTAATLQRTVNRAFRRAGVPGTFHALRHRYGTIGYQATGGDLLALGKMMGHASPVTTAIYADPSNDVATKIAAAVVR